MRVQRDLFDPAFDKVNGPKQRKASTASARRDDGMHRSVAHAGHEWAVNAYGYVEQFVALGLPFRAEQVRMYAHTMGLPPPPDGRAWGAVFMQASRKRLIRRVGFIPCSDPKSHCAPVSVWVGKGKED